MKKIDNDTLTIMIQLYLTKHQIFTTDKIVPAYIKEWIEENYPYYPAFGKIEMKQIIKVLKKMHKQHFIKD